MQVNGNQNDQSVRLNTLQGALPVRRLQRAVRLFQVYLSELQLRPQFISSLCTAIMAPTWRHEHILEFV